SVESHLNRRIGYGIDPVFCFVVKPACHPGHHTEHFKGCPGRPESTTELARGLQLRYSVAEEQLERPPLFSHLSEVFILNRERIMKYETELTVGAYVLRKIPDHGFQPLLRFLYHGYPLHVGVQNLLNGPHMDTKEQMILAFEIVVETGPCKFCSAADVSGRSGFKTFCKKQLRRLSHNIRAFLLTSRLSLLRCHVNLRQGI